MNIGLYFGSFNPIHNGHLAIAKYMLAKKKLNQVWFIVSPQNPHKRAKDLLDEQERLALVRKAIKGNKKLKASAVEFELERPSYTISTLNFLQKKYPHHHFFLILGSDSLTRFTEWKDYKAILRMCPLLVYPRPGAKKIPAPFRAFVLEKAPLMKISATEIRRRIKQEKSTKGLLPKEAERYIIKKGFYH
jgi:nicotinate-nucleotide adenylyltransferase